MPARNYKAQCGLAIKIYPVKILILNNSAIWIVNTKPQKEHSIAKFYLEECAIHVVIEGKSVLVMIIVFSFMM